MMVFDKFWHRTLNRPYKLNVVDTGGDKPVVVLLHGIAESTEDWRPVVEVLSANFRCIAIDLLGFGDSPKPQWSEYETEDHIRSIKLTIRSLLLSDKFILVGHSLGCLLASRYAVENTKQVERLVLVSPPIYVPLETIKNKSARLRNQLLIKSYQAVRNNPRLTPENFKKVNRLLPHLSFSKLFTSQPDTWVPFIKTLENSIEKQSALEDLNKLSVPIDIFYGSLDRLVIGNTIETLKNRKNVTVHKLTTAHNINVRYAKALSEFLRKHS